MKQRIIKAVYPSRLAHGVMRLASPLSTAALNRLADAYRHLDTGMTERLRYNYAAAFPHLTESEIEEITKRNWRARFQTEHERVQLNCMPREQLIRYCGTNVETIGAEHLRAACESPEPVVFFTPHYGSFAVACLRVILDVEKHKTISLFYDPPEVNPTTAMYKGLIERMGCNSKILLNDRTAVLKGLRALKNGNALGIMPDVYEYSPGLMFVPFFGRLAVAMGGTAFFALKSNARLIPVYCYRRARSRFVLQYGAPIELSRTGDFNRDVYRTTARIFANIQEQLTARPEHWVYWDSLYDRFAFSADVNLPAEGESWEERFSVLRSTLAEGQSQLGKFLASFEMRLRQGDAQGVALGSSRDEKKAVVNG
jgi:lauroyl/myristoyl acyltransferase